MSEANKNRVRTKESGQNISNSLQGHTVSNETREKISKSLTGRELPEETRLKMSEARKGIPKTETHKNKIGLANAGKTRTEEQIKCMRESRKNSIPVGCSNGMSFISVAEAVRWLKSIGYTKATISAVTMSCQQIRVKAYGFIWNYLNGLENENS